MTKRPPNLYQELGSQTIREVITKFYSMALTDVLIGHFFFNKDLETLIERQFEFTSRMLGDEKMVYHGKPVPEAHRPFFIGEPHYKRRQVLLRQAMTESGVESSTQEQWIAREDILKPMVIGQAPQKG